jgi:hypothetical protein
MTINVRHHRARRASFRRCMHEQNARKEALHFGLSSLAQPALTLVK